MRITANLTTYSGRRDILPKAIESLKTQSIPFDKIRVYCNDYIPSVELRTKYDDVLFWVDGKDLKDNGKYYWIPRLEEDEIYFTFDDDIQYPPFYVEYMLDKLSQYPECLLTLHGRKLKGKGLNYYYGHKQFHFQRELEGDAIIDVPGTGVSVFNTAYFKPNVWNSDDQCMVDVLVGLEAAKQNVEVVCVGHSMFWMKSLTDNEGSIYVQERNDCERQSEIADEIWDIKYQVRSTKPKHRESSI